MRLKLQISLSRGQLEQQGKRASAMEQGVPGSQNEHFFELLHPNAARGPPPPPSSSVDAAAEESPLQDPPPLYDIPPSYDFQLTHSSEPSMSGDVGAKLEDSPNRGPSLTSSGDDHHHVFRVCFHCILLLFMGSLRVFALEILADLICRRFIMDSHSSSLRKFHDLC